MTDISPLRRVLDETIAEHGCSMKDLTVLAPQNDPFRLDTPARHRDGEWLAIARQALGLEHRTIHLRGLHYRLIGQPKPDGTPYTNTDTDWLWLSGDAAKAARFLGYIPFDRIADHRNAAPVVRILEREQPHPYLSVGVYVNIPDAVDLKPYVGAVGFEGVQPYKLVMVGEKSSLDEVLGPVAQRFGSDLYLPTGCMSDTLIHTMAKIGADDGRPMVVFYFSDCDPSGWNMPIEVGRKLQALTTTLYPDLDFQMFQVALTPDQVREYGLPSTPLKDTEKRADKWLQATGTKQTEIDALAALRPDLLRQIATYALDQFYDKTLNRRVFEAEAEWREEAQAVVDASTDQTVLDHLRQQAQAKLDDLRTEIAAINNALQLDIGDFELPEIIVPEPHINGVHGKALLDSRWSFIEQTRRLIDSKAYGIGGAA